MDNNLDNKNDNSALTIVIAGVILLVIAAVLVFFFLLNGNIVSVASNSNIKAVQSVVCENDNVIYPFFQDVADGHHLKINMILEDDELDTISLVYKLYYKDVAVIEQENVNFRVAMGKSFGANGLGADSLNATYSSLPDAVQLTLYAEQNDISDVASRYLLLDEIDGDYKKDAIVKVYNSIGLNCIINEK